MNKRDEIQQKGVELYNKYTISIMEIATGVGKSLIALKAVSQFPDKKHLLILSEKNARENWYNDAVKWGYKEIYNNLDVILYHSLHKLNGNSYHTVILDEANHVFTSLRIKALRNINNKKALLLSATLGSKGHKYFNLYPNGLTEEVLINKNTVLYSYPFKEAVKNNILKNPTIYIIRVDLDEEQIIEYNKIAFKLEGAKYYENYDAMKRIGLQRKRFLSDCKINTAKELYKKLQKKKRRLIFFANRVNHIQNYKNAVYGNKSDKKNREIIENFNNLRIHSLIAVGKLQEVVNLEEIQAAIILQLDSSIRGVVQKIGRALRSENPEVYIPIANNTNDEVLLERHLGGLSNYLKEYKIY